MMEALIGGVIGAGIAALGFRALQVQLTEELEKTKLTLEITRRSYSELIATANDQVIEYWRFRREYEAYRARHDPITIKKKGNVIAIKRSCDDKTD